MPAHSHSNASHDCGDGDDDDDEDDGPMIKNLPNVVKTMNDDKLIVTNHQLSQPVSPTESNTADASF